MKRSPELMLAVSVFLLALVSSFGCAHKAADKTTTSAPAAQAVASVEMKYKNIVVAFTLSPKGVAETEPKPYLEQAQNACIEQLTASGLYNSVKAAASAAPKEGSVLVQGELTSMRIVSRATRFWVGAFAGNSEMMMHVKLVDAATGAVVAEDDVNQNTHAMAGAWSIGGADNSLPGQVGAQVAEYVVAKTRK